MFVENTFAYEQYGASHSIFLSLENGPRGQITI